MTPHRPRAGADPVTRPVTRSAAKPAARPVPVRSDAYTHLTVEALREYRRALQAEEGNVSYWRRILQARLDVLRAGGQPLNSERLRPLLTDARVGAGRTALAEVLPVDDVPPLPSLAELWERRVGAHDPDGQAAFDRDLSVAEEQLSAYRAALHRRLGEATGELIARYREDPTLCLTALPLPVSRIAERGGTRRPGV